MSYTGAKGSHLANKKTKCWVQQKSKGITKVCPGLAHRTVRCATGQCPVHQETPKLNFAPSGKLRAAAL
jgi:hypothetical protein